MDLNRKKEEYIELANALEKDIITVEQFHILSNIQDFKKVRKIIEILKIKGILNKEEVFEQLLTHPDISFIQRVFMSLPIYRTDLARQRFLFHLPVNAPLEILSFLADDQVWKDSMLMDFLFKIADRIAHTCGKADFYHAFTTLLTEHPEFLKQSEMKRLLYRIFELDYFGQAEVFLHYLGIESFQKEPCWFDHLIHFYNYYTADDIFEIPDYSKKFQLFEEQGLMPEITKKLLQIEELECSNEDKESSIVQFLSNLDWIKETEIRLHADESYFHTLLNCSFHIDIENYNMKELIKVLDKKGLPEQEIINICILMDSIYDETVKDIVIRAMEEGLLEIADIYSLIGLDSEETRAFIMTKAIEKNSEKFIEQEKNRFGEQFSVNFCTYIDHIELTKDQILKIRDQIKNASSSFCGNAFILDIDHVIPKKYYKSEIETEGEEEIEIGTLEPLEPKSPFQKVIKFLRRE